MVKTTQAMPNGMKANSHKVMNEDRVHNTRLKVAAIQDSIDKATREYNDMLEEQTELSLRIKAKKDIMAGLTRSLGSMHNQLVFEEANIDILHLIIGLK